MDKKDWLTIAPIVAGLLGLVITPILSEFRVFHIYPDFSVRVTTTIEEQVTKETFTVQNIEKVQAKNAIVYVQANNTLTKTDDSCFEGTFPSDRHKNVFRIEFPRMSPGITCDVFFTSNNTKIISAIVTSDDSPGHNYVPTKPKSVEAQALSTTVTEYIELEKVINTAYQWVFVASVLDLVSFMIYFVQRRLRHRKRFKAYQVAEKEIINSIQRTRDQFDFLYKATLLEEQIPAGVKNKLVWLKDEIIESTRELYTVRAKMYTPQRLEEPVEQFFSNLGKFEQKLLELAHKNQLIMMEIPTTRSVVKELQRRQILTEQFVTEFEQLNAFRNQLVHGLMRPSKRQLNTQKDRLIDLIAELKLFD